MNQRHRSLRKSIPSLHGLLLFEASARHLNFSKAAEELVITQSAVSHGVRQLEQSLGHALFLRENRALALTSQGQRLFVTVSHGFSSIAETISDISAADQKDTLVVSCTTTMATEWLLPNLPKLRVTHPHLRIEVHCLDREPELMANGIDVQLRLGDGNWPDYDVIRLWPEVMVALGSPAYLRCSPPITALPDLLQHRLIMYVDPFRLRLGWSEWLRELGVEMTSRLQVAMLVNDALVSLQAAQTGEGLVLGWYPTIERSLAERRLEIALSDSLTTGRHFYILTPRYARNRRVVRQFCDWLVAEAANSRVFSVIDSPKGRQDMPGQS